MCKAKEILMCEGLRCILEITAWRMETPQMFGALHLALLSAAVCLPVFGVMRAKRLSSDRCVRLLTVCGWVLVILELYKQLFLFFVVHNGVYDWWYFPFQLCSVPMYLCILLPLIVRSELLKSAVLNFLASFTFVSAVAALVYPEDFLRSYVTLTLHGFIWHGILLFISLTSALTGIAALTKQGFARSVVLFISLCFVAVFINIYAEPAMAAAHSAGLLSDQYAAMFYLNPYHLSPQLLIGTIQKSAGIPAGLALYIAVIIAVSGCVHRFAAGYSLHSKR